MKSVHLGNIFIVGKFYRKRNETRPVHKQDSSPESACPSHKNIFVKDSHFATASAANKANAATGGSVTALLVHSYK